MTEALAIEVSNLTKWYGDHRAISDVSFRVRKGEVVGFLGPNGAGKSTTLRILTGFLSPTAGRVQILGRDIESDPLSARGALGYMPETCPLYPELRVEEYLEYRARLKHVKPKQRLPSVARAMRQAGIFERRGSLIGQLSKGLRQRVGLADALVAEPSLLILDEPTAGLDPNQIREIRALISELRGQHTLLLSTHILQEVEMVCDRAVVLSRGRVVGDGTLEELRRSDRGKHAELSLGAIAANPVIELQKALSGFATIDESRERDGLVHCSLTLKQPQLALAPVIEILARKGVPVHEARLEKTRLEDVFRELTEAVDE